MSWFSHEPKWPGKVVASKLAVEVAFDGTKIRRWLLQGPSWPADLVLDLDDPSGCFVARRLSARVWDVVLAGRRVGHVMRVPLSKDWVAMFERELPVKDQSRVYGGQTRLGFFTGGPEAAITVTCDAEACFQGGLIETFSGFLDEQMR